MKKIILTILLLLCLTGCTLLNKEKDLNEYESIKYYEGGPIDSDKIAYQNMLITSYSKYLEVINHYNIQLDIKEENFTKFNYLTLIAEDRYCNGKIDSLAGIKLEDNELYVRFNINKTCNECAIRYYLYLVELDKSKYREEKVVRYEYVPINEIYCDK